MMSGPKKIIDLDETSNHDKWRVDDNALHLYQDKLWQHQIAGCVLCAEAERTDAKGQTLRLADDEHQFVCLTHGELDEIPFSIRRDYVIKFGHTERTGFQEFKDSVLMPKSLSNEDRTALIERLIDTVSTQQNEEDLLSDD